MWIVFAFLSALFAGITSVLAKCGVKKTDSAVATALRTGVVLLCAWGMAFVAGSVNTLPSIDAKTWVFLILSGFATGASWLCYFKALQTGDINKVAPVDKSSALFTAVFAALFLHEPLTLTKGAGVIIAFVGTLLMISKQRGDGNGNAGGKQWLIYAVLSAVFASLTSILGKAGITGVQSDLGTAIRTVAVLITAWGTVFLKGAAKEVRRVPKKELLFIVLSGVATGASWLCYYKALKTGDTLTVSSIDKLSVVITVLFSRAVFKEKLTAKACAGLILLVCGTLVMLI
ncbi:MAG: EamA family transporter [Candidatus Scatosoma sp.]